MVAPESALLIRSPPRGFVMHDADQELLHRIGGHRRARSTRCLMWLAVTLAVAIAVFLLAVTAVLVWASRSRTRAETTVTDLRLGPMCRR
jgi:hypothetical protein